jgi:putative transposase
MAVSCTGAHCPQDRSLAGVRWYVAYPLRTRHVAELMRERGIKVDHATVNRWVITDSPQLEEALHRRQRPVWISWRMDETDIRVKGEWRYRSRAVDTPGQTMDFLLTEHRDQEAARRFLTNAIRRHGVPEPITMEGREAHAAAIKRDHEACGPHILIGQMTYVHTRVAQDHRGGKRGTRPRLGFKSFAAAQDTRVGIELMPMLKTRQLVVEAGDEGLSAADQFYTRAA